MRQPLNPDLAQNLKNLVQTGEEWLVKRIMFYLKSQGYDVYLPDSDKWLVNALRQLNAPVCETPVVYFGIPELHPHADFTCDPYAQFGINQARLFLRRKLDVVIFFGIFKYIRQSYEDLIQLNCSCEEDCRLCRSFMKRYFDHVELGFMNEYKEYATKGFDDCAEQVDKQKRRAGMRLAESESFRSALMEGIAGAALVLNMETCTIEEFNKKAGELFPFLNGEEVPEPVFYDDAGSNPLGLFELADRAGSNEEKLMETPGGMMPMRVFSIEVWLQNQRHRFVIMFDITREKMLERRLGHVQHLESIGEIALGLPIRMGSASAEITATLKSAIHALKECPNRCGSIAANELLPHVIEAEKYLTDLTAILNALASITQKDNIEKEHVFIDTLVKNCALLTSDKWQPYGDMELNLAKQQGVVRCYADEIGQMVLNLLVNASYAVRKKSEADGTKGKITVSTRFTKDFFELKVADTGIGIKKQDYKRIFDPGFTTKEVGRGTGHGLALVYDIAVNRYNGTIQFKSSEGVGTEFTVRIPLG
jgi:signal transduction histidine kinase